MKKLKIREIKIMKSLLFILMIISGIYFKTFPAEAYTIYDSPYVTFSPDGLAWTTDAGRQDIVWYQDDGSDDIVTGAVSALRRPGRGEHYYSVRRVGSIPIARWRVELAKVNCCHHDYPSDGQYHGVMFARQICLKPHFSAWRPICADCGSIIVKNYFYMSKEAAASIVYLDVGPEINYYYLCPFNNNLEQGVGLTWHRCKNISYNRYRVEYMPNTEGASYTGSMQPSFHMYENAAEYEGQEITPQTKLNPNGYKRTGWVFLGWNTEADGSGEFYEDEAEILNLCEDEYQPGENTGTVKLYAMWKKVTGKLSIMLIGVSYNSMQGMYTVNVPYGDKYVIETNKFLGNRGYYVAFVQNGGTGASTIWTVKKFAGLRSYEGQTLKGELRGNIYYFAGEDGDWDKIEPVFEQPEVTLPTPRKANYSFGGWYYDSRFTQFAGYGGDKVLPVKSTYLYARWVELNLESQTDMEVYNGTGAVDLRWSQEDPREKVYQIYRSGDGVDWQQVFDDDAIYIETPEETIYRSDAFGSVYEAPYDGFYHLEAHGAQGQGYDVSRGGYGGKAEGFFYLEEGEKLFFYSKVQSESGESSGTSTYGCGGEFAAVESDRQGLLLLAGGGGGAGPGVDGGDGGADTIVAPVNTGQRYGENGMIGTGGGGGGFRGGNAGTVVVHDHTEGVCNHVHQGSSDQQSGCYTIPVKCGMSLEHTLYKTKHWYWAGTDTIYCPACGADATKGETCCGHDTYYYKHVCLLHGERSDNTTKDKPKICSKIVRYDVGCGLTTEYTCGYMAGEVLSAHPSAGGSSYINADQARSYGFETGENVGDAWVGIYYEPELFSEKTELEDLRATDLRAPATIDEGTIQKLPSGAELIDVCWEEPEDMGSIYFHQVKSFDRTSGELICNSNITRDVLVSGVDGYYYMIDEGEDTQYEEEVFRYTEDRKLQIRLTDRERYLHLAASDRAGNVGEVIHVRIQSRNNEGGEIRWPVYTRPLGMEDAATIYQRDPQEPYYVKCDGSTPFGMYYSAYMAGQPAENYQLNQCIFENVENDRNIGRNIVRVPEMKVSQERIAFQTQELKYETDDDPILQIGTYAEAVRQNGSRELTLRQRFIFGSECDGRRFRIIPVACVCTGDISVFSDHTLDEQNGLEIIGDGTAPVISGLDIMEEYALLDRREGSVEIVVTAEDRLSGVKELYLEINNLDNGSYAKVYPDEDGTIRINITEDQPEFSGDFTLSVYAEDHVGNAVTEEYRTTEFDLWADIERVLAPHEPQFKKGESGILKITSWGYADRVEVQFPDEFGDDRRFDHVYTYEMNPSYRQDEELEFAVPLYVPEESGYRVTVRAYKGDRMLEVHPAIAVMGISGSVLDEVRTRLR